MANNSTEVRLAPDGRVWVAPVGTTLPTSAVTSLNVAFKELGYVDEDGVELTPGVELTDIRAWQSAVPVKTTLDTVNFEVTFKMMQINTTTLGLYFFNSTFTNNFGEGKAVLNSNPGSQEKALVIEWKDDEGDWTRLVCPRAVLSDREALSLVRNDAQKPGITWRLLDTSGVMANLYTQADGAIPST